MSVVNNYLVLAPCGEEGVLPTLNAALKKAVNIPGFSQEFKDVKDSVGGSKVLEAEAYAAALNYVVPQYVTEAMRAVSWEEPDNVQLLVNLQEDETWRFIDWQRDRWQDGRNL